MKCSVKRDTDKGCKRNVCLIMNLLKNSINVSKMNWNFVDIGVSDWRCVCIGLIKNLRQTHRKIAISNFFQRSNGKDGVPLFWEIGPNKHTKLLPMFFFTSLQKCHHSFLRSQLNYICVLAICQACLCFSGLSASCFFSQTNNDNWICDDTFFLFAWIKPFCCSYH